MSGNRTSAYSAKEKLLLEQLVKDNNVVLNKKIGGATLAEKRKAWESITDKYNSQPEVNIRRTSGQLRKLLNNLKQRKRKQTTAVRYSLLALDGDSQKKAIVDSVLHVVEDAAPSLDINFIFPRDSTELLEKRQTEAKKKLDKGVDEVIFEKSELVECIAKESIPKLLLSQTLSNSGDVQSLHSSNNIDIEHCSPWKQCTQLLFEEENRSESGSSVGTSTIEGPGSVNTENISESFSSISGTTSAAEKYRYLKRKDTGVKVALEKGAKIRKVADATHQQQEIHNIKKKIAEEELLRVIEGRKQEELQTEKIKFEVRRAELTMQTARQDLRRAMDEAELAALKLQLFKSKLSKDQ